MVVAAAFVFGFFLWRRRPEETVSELRHEDKGVLKFIDESGGKVLESELRQKFLLPRTSLWRLVRRLERMGYVRVSKVGMQNVIELIRKGV